MSAPVAPSALVTTARVSARARRAYADWGDRDLNFEPVTFDQARRSPAWRVDEGRTQLPSERPGPAEQDGPFAVAHDVMVAYEFADPALVRAVYSPSSELEGRTMLLVGRFLGLRFHMGVRVGGVVDEHTECGGRPVQRFRWHYRTLDGHLERGHMEYELLKWTDTGTVEFIIRAYSQRARIDNVIVRLGFRLFGRSSQLRFYERSLRRMETFVATRATTTEGGPDMATRYEFAFDPRFRGLLRLAGITPERSHVDVTDGHLEARFGPWIVRTPLGNIAGVVITGPHRPFRAIGPRYSPSTHSLTFGSNAWRTLRLEFRDPVTGIEPTGSLRHPSLSLSVAEPEKLKADLDGATTRR